MSISTMLPSIFTSMVNWPISWNPGLQTVKRMVDDGAIGKVIEIKTRMGHTGPLGPGAKHKIAETSEPMTEAEKDGAFTAAAKAIAAVQPGYGNTAPFQLELNDTIIDRENAIENVAAVLKGHFDMGGTLVNVNIVDKDQILAANEDPSAYPNLIVRVTGFTAYFSALSPEFRQLVVDRIISL